MATAYGHPAAPGHGGDRRDRLYLPPEQILQTFTAYMDSEATIPNRAQFEANDAKLRNALFVTDIRPLLRPGLDYDVGRAWKTVPRTLVRHLPGDPWKGGAA